MAGSITGAIFAQSAAELVEKLDGDDTPEAVAMLEEANRLGVVFRGWTTVAPTPEERATALNRLIELNRSVLIHLSERSGRR